MSDRFPMADPGEPFPGLPVQVRTVKGFPEDQILIVSLDPSLAWEEAVADMTTNTNPPGCRAVVIKVDP